MKGQRCVDKMDLLDSKKWCGYVRPPLSLRGPLGPWQSPGTRLVSTIKFDGWYQGSTTSLRLEQ